MYRFRSKITRNVFLRYFFPNHNLTIYSHYLQKIKLRTLYMIISELHTEKKRPWANATVCLTKINDISKFFLNTPWWFLCKIIFFFRLAGDASNLRVTRLRNSAQSSTIFNDKRYTLPFRRYFIKKTRWGQTKIVLEKRLKPNDIAYHSCCESTST